MFLGRALGCAQRLTASEVCPVAYRIRSLAPRNCAQRLTASEVCPVGGELPPPAAGRCSTPYGIRGVSSCVKICRSGGSYCAQRLTASEVCPVPPLLLVFLMFAPCSTPYGIRGVSRWAAPDAAPGRILCSTPYGIRGVSRLLNLPQQPRNQSCSTPYGIRGVSSSAIDFLHLGFRVLNALRHQRCVQSAPASAEPALTSAQRLTASEVCPARLGALRLPAPFVLNALRHQRCVQYITVYAISGVPVCSTPYGIRGVSRVLRTLAGMTY